MVTEGNVGVALGVGVAVGSKEFVNVGSEEDDALGVAVFRVRDAEYSVLGLGDGEGETDLEREEERRVNDAWYVLTVAEVSDDGVAVREGGGVNVADSSRVDDTVGVSIDRVPVKLREREADAEIEAVASEVPGDTVCVFDCVVVFVNDQVCEVDRSGLELTDDVTDALKEIALDTVGPETVEVPEGDADEVRESSLVHDAD